MLTTEQIKQIEKRGFLIENVNQQIQNFIQGFPFANVIRPATLSDGILKLSEEQIETYKNYYLNKKNEQNIIKFVPASGAASRMFKDLFGFINDPNLKVTDSVNQFSEGLQKFAFYSQLQSFLSKNLVNIHHPKDKYELAEIIKTLLLEQGMNYGNLPKGLLTFHMQHNNAITPIEEHMVEGALYATGANNTARLHFTVSPEHQKLFENHVKNIQKNLEDKFGISYDISFSQQKKATDTIAVDLENNPFEEAGSILFRPAGHGALLNNLNELDGDVVFIKNIDNVVPDHLKNPTVLYKQVIGGVLLETQSQIFRLLDQLDEDGSNNLKIAEDFISQKLGLKTFQNEENLPIEKRISKAKAILDRPIRVCGIVKNTGEPGGAPFWVKNEKGEESLQILESAQINMQDEKQKQHFLSSTHFNPTDLVCGIKNRKGEAFNLMEYRDLKAGFISKKSLNGKDLKAQELPGLWNGSMSDWNSLMVEVPIETFNPVKTVNDLLKKSHQPPFEQ